MHCATPWRDLGPVRWRPLRRAVRALDEAAWDADTFRQERFRVHRQTRSVRLVWTHHDDWPKTQTEVLPAWSVFEPVLTPILSAASVRLERPLTLANAMLARLDPGCAIKAHVDVAPFFKHCHRLHLPLETHAEVVFEVGGDRAPMQQGHLYEIDNRRLHAVRNEGDAPRIHLIVDLAPQ